MKKIIIICILLSSLSIFSQDSSFFKKLRFGGEFGLSFGSNSKSITALPTVVYDFDEEFSLGLGAGYTYSKRNDFESNVLSHNIIALYRPIKTIEFSADLQQLYVKRKQGTISENYNYPALNIGVSYRTGAVSLGLKYDVLYNKDKSVFSSPISPVLRILF